MTLFRFFSYFSYPTLKCFRPVYYEYNYDPFFFLLPKTGEELTIDYGYVYYLTEKQQRQLSLKSQYFFECICVACRNNWPLRSKLASGIPAFK